MSKERDSEITVLAIESSCDDVGIAIVTNKRNILANNVYTQNHKRYGGIVPEIASRVHSQIMPQLCQSTLLEVKKNINDIDVIAVTNQPGLIGGLIVGCAFAKGIASSSNKICIPVNHLVGHALTPRLTDTNLFFPYLLLLISGGNTKLTLVKSPIDFLDIGETVDDAVGEVFDKIGGFMNLEYPAGLKIESYSSNGDQDRFKFPKPFYKKNHANFSFSGLKTAVRIEIEKLRQNGKLSKQDICDISASFQKCISEILIDRIQYAINYIKNTMNMEIKNIVIAGGVASNNYLRKSIKEYTNNYNLDFFVSPPYLCTDNAAMIAWAAIEIIAYNLGIFYENIAHQDLYSYKLSSYWDYKFKPIQ